jgi:hypothetical protein
MAGLVPAIHVFPGLSAAKTWMPGTRQGMTKLGSKAPIPLAAFESDSQDEVSNPHGEVVASRLKMNGAVTRGEMARA